MDNPIKVILAEDSELLRHTLAASLREHPDITLLDEAENGAKLLACCLNNPPDVAVLDIRMPIMDGITAAKALRKKLPEVKLLILTTFDDDLYLRELFGIGVDGYLLKSGSSERLAEAVRNVYNGLGAVDNAISRKLGDLLNQPQSKFPQGVLSPAEQRVGDLLVAGKYNKEISLMLNISYGHTRNLVSRVYAKTGAVDREDLIIKLGESK